MELPPRFVSLDIAVAALIIVHSAPVCARVSIKSLRVDRITASVCSDKVCWLTFLSVFRLEHFEFRVHQRLSCEGITVLDRTTAVLVGHIDCMVEESPTLQSHQQQTLPLCGR